MSDFHEGGCLCGAVRYRTEGLPVFSMVCHCRACQHRTGSAFGIGAYFPEPNVAFLQGNLKSFRFESDESGRWLQTEFCSQCGTTLTWTLELRPQVRAIAGGTFDEPGWHGIDRHIWTDSAHPWVVHPPGAAVFKRGVTS